MSDSATFCATCGAVVPVDVVRGAGPAQGGYALRPSGYGPPVYGAQPAPYGYQQAPAASQAHRGTAAAASWLSSGRNALIVIGIALGVAALWAVIMVATGRSLAVVSLVMMVVGFVVGVGCLFAGSAIMGDGMKVGQLLATPLVASIAAGVAGALIPLPFFSLLVFFALALTLITSFTSADWFDAAAIIVIWWVLSMIVEFMLASLFGLALMRALSH